MSERRYNWKRRLVIARSIYCVETKQYHYIRFGIVKKHTGKGGTMWKVTGRRRTEALAYNEAIKERYRKSSEDARRKIEEANGVKVTLFSDTVIPFSDMAA